MKLSELHVRDPFILPFENKYYFLFSPGKYAWDGCEGFYVTVSEDLEDWSEPIKVFTPPEGFWSTNNFWAPELHYYRSAFYIFSAFGAKVGHKRTMQILKADNPLGPFEVWSCPITPNNMNCIDGTLYIENDVPYMIYSREVIDVPDRVGEMRCVELSKDLKEPIGEHMILFKGNEPIWSKSKEKYLGIDPLCSWVAEGPFFHKTSDGKLLMLWSSHSGPKCYIEAVSYTENGSLFGKWKHCNKFLMDSNGGHGMLFKAFDGNLKFTLHYPNGPFGDERAKIHSVTECKNEPFLQIKVD